MNGNPHDATVKFPSLRKKPSAVENVYSFGSRTAWLRFVMTTAPTRFGDLLGRRW